MYTTVSLLPFPHIPHLTAALNLPQGTLGRYMPTSPADGTHRSTPASFRFGICNEFMGLFFVFRRSFFYVGGRRLVDNNFVLMIAFCFLNIYNFGYFLKFIT